MFVRCFARLLGMTRQVSAARDARNVRATEKCSCAGLALGYKRVARACPLGDRDLLVRRAVSQEEPCNSAEKHDLDEGGQRRYDEHRDNVDVGLWIHCDLLASESENARCFRYELSHPRGPSVL